MHAHLHSRWVPCGGGGSNSCSSPHQHPCSKRSLVLLPAAAAHQQQQPHHQQHQTPRVSGTSEGCNLAAGGSRSSRQRAQLTRASAAAAAASADGLTPPGARAEGLNVVYKFGGSSVRDADRMREVADIVCSFPDLLPVVVLSAMGKTTNLLLDCGNLALETEFDKIPELEPLKALHTLHMDTCEALNVELKVREEIKKLLYQLEQLLVGISLIQDLTPRAKDNLVSFGERMSTRIFASYLRSMGVPARQYDAFKMGFVTTDDFCNADIVYEEAMPRLRAAFAARADQREVPILTGFLGVGQRTGAITTLGRGGSDLSATAIGAALDLPEVQVWKDVDGVLTSDPRLVDCTQTVDELTFEEATELAYFGAQVLHPQAMQPAIRSGKMGVRVKNSYNRSAPGTVIKSDRDMSNVLITSIVLKSRVTLVDIISLRMMGQFGFLATVFEAFGKHKLSVDVVATSEVSVSVTLDPRKFEDLQSGLGMLKTDLGKIAKVSSREDLSIISLICNVQRTSKILQHTFEVLNDEGINVVMLSQGASKTNISLVVEGCDGQRAVKALHEKLFQKVLVKEMKNGAVVA